MGRFILKLWVTYPVEANELVKLHDESFDKDWFDALSFELRVRNAEFPVMPEYKNHSFRGTQQLSRHPVFERLKTIECSILPFCHLFNDSIRHFTNKRGRSSASYISLKKATISLFVIPFAYSERI